MAKVYRMFGSDAVAGAWYVAIADRSELDPILDQAGCRTWLAAENNRGAR